MVTLLTYLLAWLPLLNVNAAMPLFLPDTQPITPTVISYGGPYMTEPDSVNLPTIAITQTQPISDDGYIFFATFRGLNDLTTPNYLIILDGNGDYIYFGRTPENRIAMDFKVAEIAGTPRLSHFLTANFDIAWAEGDYRVLNQQYQEIDRWTTTPDYVAENHELLLLENGNALLMAYDEVEMDLSVYGGQPDATVIDVVIQELDAARTLQFEWRSLDHIPVTDTYVSLTAQVVDYAHANSLEIDSDDNLIVSFRNTSQVVKIDRMTGAVLWQLGGRQNEFTFVNETMIDNNGMPQAFAFQHDARRLPNGNLTLFDNGNGLHDAYSRAVEYELNEMTKTVTRTWQALDEHTVALGNAQRLPSGNTLINWGFAGKLTEVSPDEVRLREMELVGDGTYRAFRLPWVGDPTTVPKLATRTATTTTTLYMSWNGATEVATYVVYAGQTADTLVELDRQSRTGFETSYRVPLTATDPGCFWQVAAADLEGDELARSAVVLLDTEVCLQAYGERIYLPYLQR